MRKIATLFLLLFMLGATPAMAMSNAGDNVLGFVFSLVSDDATPDMADESPAAMSVTPTPIPGAIWLLGTGLVGLVGLRSRKNRF